MDNENGRYGRCIICNSGDQNLRGAVGLARCQQCYRRFGQAPQAADEFDTWLRNAQNGLSSTAVEEINAARKRMQQENHGER